MIFTMLALDDCIGESPMYFVQHQEPRVGYKDAISPVVFNECSVPSLNIAMRMI